MNKFLVILCLALLASAAAKPAYNYPQPSKNLQGGGFKLQQPFRPSQAASSNGVFSANLSPQIKPNFEVSGNGGSLVSSGSAQLSQSISLPAQQFAPPAPQLFNPVPQQQLFTPAVPQFAAPVQAQQQFIAPAPQFVAPVQQQQLSVPIEQQFLAPAPVAQFQPQGFPQQQTIISKDIYIHSAPEELEEIGNDSQNGPSSPIRKNYRIVFIKAPTQNVKLNVDALKRSQAANEEKTVIYVLSKKPDLSEIQGQLVAAQSEQKAHKPEVYFIKYKTQEEANRAQQEIQAQYDSLGGSTHISDEGVAPVHSVIGGGAINVGHIANGIGNSNGFQGANNFGSQQQFVQQSYQSSQSTLGSSGATVSFGGAPSQKYLPAKKK